MLKFWIKEQLLYKVLRDMLWPLSTKNCQVLAYAEDIDVSNK